MFRLENTDKSTKARAGVLRTPHGRVQTPVFMPVGTQGTVKAVSPHELEALGAKIILGNAYHLFLRPGDSVIREAGGLHQFSGWPFPMLTDSGGYQVFSLATLRKITNDGIEFQSHLDGSTHAFTPERVVDIQRNIGADVMMVLDECTAYPSSYEAAMKANDRTMQWAERCLERFRASGPPAGKRQAIFGIVQGSTYEFIRKVSAERLTEMGFDGYGIGGLAVGEPGSAMLEMTDLCTELLPPERPRYLMGVGKPEDIVQAIGLGVDMFDCVIPTRNGRNGTVYTWEGKLNVRNRIFEDDFSPIDGTCGCYACQHFSRAYIRHLFHAGEILGLRLATIHNLHFYMELVRKARQSILEERFEEWRNEFFRKYVMDAEETCTLKEGG
ncbi:MAG: tRNA guanosine(34) transglycosylase Tgt [bacterium]